MHFHHHRRRHYRRRHHASGDGLLVSMFTLMFVLSWYMLKYTAIGLWLAGKYSVVGFVYFGAYLARRKAARAEHPVPGIVEKSNTPSD